MQRNEKISNPSTTNQRNFNLVKDFLYANNKWGKVNFSAISSRENLNSTTFDSPYRLYAKATYSKIAIGYEEFSKQTNKVIEDKINNDWHVTINRQEQASPYYILDYGTWSLVYILFNDEEYWNTYIKAEKTIQKKTELSLNLQCVQANCEIALDTINYVLQKDADNSFEPHLLSDIEKYLKAEWSNEPHVKTENDLIHYEEWGTVYPIDKNKVQELRHAFFQLSGILREKYSIENDKIYSVSEIVKKLETIYENEKNQDFDDYERIKNIISEFKGKLKTPGGQNFLDKEIDEEENTKENLISDENINYKRYSKYHHKSLKIDTDKILSQLINSFEVTISKINIFFMFDSGYRAFLVQYIKRFAKDYFVNKASSALRLIENNPDTNNRKNTDNKIFYCWQRILENIVSQIYDVNPNMLIGCFGQSANKQINNRESFDTVYQDVKEIDLNVIENSILRGEKLNKTDYTVIFNKWFESIKKDIQKHFNQEKDTLKFVFNTTPGEIKTSTKYVDSITKINLFKLNEIIKPIINPFVALIKNNDNFLDFETITNEIEKAVNTGLFEEQTFYKVAFEVLKTGNKKKPAGDIWSNLWTQYQKTGGKLYSKQEFITVMNFITDLDQPVPRELKSENVKRIYSELESLIDTKNKSKFMQKLRMLLPGADLIFTTDKNNDLKNFCIRCLQLMKDLGYSFVRKYDNNPKKDDSEQSDEYVYKTSLEKIISEIE